MKVFLAILAVSISAVLGAYDDSFARYEVFPLAGAAYGDHPELCVNDNFKNSSFKRHIVISCDPLKDIDTCSGYSAVTYSEKAILLVFRGSEDFQVLEEVIEEVFMNRTNFIGGGSVAVYFWTAFQQVWNNGLKDDFLSLKNANPGYELWVTGHSLGAAMASIAAGYIAKMGYFPNNKIKLVTYGQPRVGDLAYANYIDSAISYSYRVIHHHDLVAHLPPIWLEMGDFKNYTHHKSEIWYDNSMTLSDTYVECDVNEGKNCSNQLEGNLFDLSIPDHKAYFNVSVGFSMDGCKGWNPNGKGSFRHKFMKIGNKKHV